MSEPPTGQPQNATSPSCAPVSHSCDQLSAASSPGFSPQEARIAMLPTKPQSRTSPELAI